MSDLKSNTHGTETGDSIRSIRAMKYVSEPKEGVSGHTATINEENNEVDVPIVDLKTTKPTHQPKKSITPFSKQNDVKDQLSQGVTNMMMERKPRILTKGGAECPYCFRVLDIMKAKDHIL